jgi:hypothetical protein
MRRCVLVFLVVAACGGKSKPAAAPPVANDPAPENVATEDEPAPTEEVLPGYEGVPACGTMIAAYSHLAECPKVPQETRDAMVQAVQSMKDSWGDPSKMDDATRKATNDACTQALDGVRQAMTSMGC